jgi:hypothetical protein
MWRLVSFVAVAFAVAGSLEPAKVTDDEGSRVPDARRLCQHA